MVVRLIVSVVLAAVSACALAQTTTPEAAQMFMSKQEIQTLVARAKADRKGAAPLVLEPILSLAPYQAQLEYRPAPAPAALHEKDAELMVVLQGTGTVVTGGKLLDQKRVNSANLMGSSVEGGRDLAVGVGDMLIVPANVPHQIVPTGGAPIVLMTMHVPYPALNWPPAP